ncbi:hypothetical protein BV394_01505 [Brevirhabdus pacifica]|uniref:Uncharacterized protein n=1 Tax=Brevirhabdus pacifica TaxID=1267768 RepID=A0A1U7DF91_9RHOB|nr:outer membrane protein transport protein [Brevirhabdus pacifica]APX88563.1 hypothetical protein BV394_01505 [Brevirhabdus pacifica]OWU79854.1 hypothetical protein ATO5_02200 [Loktanella sp. 22II-4b]PJJ86948.1 long-subunit fatty acid transport protein [Brevirhabdus pacifica]
MIRKGYLSAAALAVTATATGANAGALDRSYNNISPIFETGNYAELSFARVKPKASGTDTTVPQTIEDVAEDFGLFGAAVKFQYAPNLSMTFIVDQPYGSDIRYSGNPAGSAFGGTTVKADSSAVSAIGRYHMNERVSFHAGLRYQSIEGNVGLSGLAYGGLSGYAVNLGEDRSTGFLVGAAYEIPEIAMRASLTYHSKVTHDLTATESVNGAVVNTGTTRLETPEAINLEVQSGVAPGTLVFGSIRHANWSDVKLSPAFFNANTGGASLINLPDVTTYTIGVGRKITDVLSGSVSLGYEPGEKSDLVSPLTPANGRHWLSVGLKYELDKVTLSGGVRYTKLGDAQPQTQNTSRATFTDNDIVSIGIKVGYHF